MAKRTVLRQANTQSVNSITEQYLNINQWGGINDSTNYATVDQNSFSEANNVYVDSESELRNRPPVVSTQPFETIEVYNLEYNVYKKNIIDATDTTRHEGSNSTGSNER